MEDKKPEGDRPGEIGIIIGRRMIKLPVAGTARSDVDEPDETTPVPTGPIAPTSRKKPEWDLWGSLPELKIAQAVALSCNIDPRAIEVRSVDEKPAQDLLQFWKRLRIACASAAGGTLRRFRAGEASKRQPHAFDFVGPVVFRAWAQGLPYPWELPNEFPTKPGSNESGHKPPQLGKLVPNTTRPKPGWETWADIGQAELWAAVALSCDIEPDPPLLVDEAQPPDDLLQFFGRLSVAKENAASGALPCIPSLSVFALPDELRSIDLSKFAKWVESLPYPWELPAEFPRLHALPITQFMVETGIPSEAGGKELEGTEMSEPERPLRTRERNTLYTLIVSLAKANGYDLTNTWSQAESIAKAVEQAGYRLDTKTIDNHLKAALKALQKRANKSR